MKTIITVKVSISINSCLSTTLFVYCLIIFLHETFIFCCISNRHIFFSCSENPKLYINSLDSLPPPTPFPLSLFLYPPPPRLSHSPVQCIVVLLLSRLLLSHTDILVCFFSFLFCLFVTHFICFSYMLYLYMSKVDYSHLLLIILSFLLVYIYLCINVFTGNCIFVIIGIRSFLFLIYNSYMGIFKKRIWGQFHNFYHAVIRILHIWIYIVGEK